MAFDLPAVSQEWQADTTPYISALEAAIAATQGLVDEIHRAVAAVGELDAAMAAMHGADLHIGVDASAAAAAAAVNDLTASEWKANAAGQLLSAISESVAESELMEAAAVDTVTAAYAQQARNAALLIGAEEALALGADTVASRMAATAAASAAAGDAASSASRGYYGWWSALNLVRGANISLFGGIMGTVGGLHLLADAAIEVAAVVVPAAIALGAFGVAAAPTVAAIVTQMKNLYTVTTATGQSLYPLSGAFQRVAAAVQPEVYTLFGEALLILNHNTGTFLGLATGTGQVLDQLGARFTAAVTSGHGFSIFLANAVNDVAKLGDIIGNLGGVMGHVFAAVPGYAAVLLNIADAGSKVLEWAAGVTQPVLAAGLAIHGAFLYAGLAVTAFATLIPKALTGLAGLGLRAAVAAEGSALLGGAAEGAAAGMLGFAGAAETAAGLPWGWIGLAAAGIGVLVYAIVSAKDATQQWAASIEQMVAAAPAVNGLTALLVAQTAVATRLSAAQSTLAHTSETLSQVNLHTGVTQQVANQAYVSAQRSVFDLTGTMTQLQDQTNLYRYRIGVLGQALGSTSTAMGMLAASGIKMSQFLAYGKTQLAEIEAQVLGTAAAYRAMGQTGGMLGADMSVMNVLASDQYSAVTKLNQAWQAWIGVVTGGMQALSQFETAMTGMANDSASASASLTGSISSINSATGGMTYTLKGFGPAAMQSWQQFTSAVQQGSTVIAQMRTYMALGAVSNGQYTSTVKAVVGQMIPFTQGNKAALTMLENLALQAGGPATNNLKQLAQWAGVSGNAAQQQLAKGLEAATVAGGQLGQVAMHLAATLNTDLTNAVSAAALKASGLQGALAALGTAINHGATMSTGFHNTLAPVIADMVKLHQDVPSITAYLQGMGVQIDQAQVKAILAAAHLSTMGANAAKTGGQVAITTRQVQALNAAINALHDKTIFVHTIFQTSGAQVVGSVGGHTVAPGHAAGTAHAAAGLAMVGEYGPELMAFGGGERVWNASQTAAILAMSRQPSVHPAALMGAPAAGGGHADGVIENHIHVTLDGSEVFNSVQRNAYKYMIRNSGVASGLLIPGKRIGGTR